MLQKFLAPMGMPKEAGQASMVGLLFQIFLILL
jgi:hypothetical protein